MKFLEYADHRLFDISSLDFFAQCMVSICGYSWIYALTRRPKVSILAALPPFLVNLLYAGTHRLCHSLDVLVRPLFASTFTLLTNQSWLSYGIIHFISPSSQPSGSGSSPGHSPFRTASESSPTFLSQQQHLATATSTAIPFPSQTTACLVQQLSSGFSTRR